MGYASSSMLEPDQQPADDPGAQAEDAAPRCEACDDCHSKRDEVGPGVPVWDDFKQLATPDDLINFPRLTASTQLKHIAEGDGILARYEFPTKVICSLKGGHRHNQGIVVRMLCGVTLCMGFDCGKQSIIRFKEILKDYDRRRKFATDRGTIETWPEQFRARIATLAPALDQRRTLEEALRVKLPELHGELLRRHRKGAGGLEVTIPADRIGAKEDQLRHLAGLALLDARKHDPARLRTCLENFVRQRERQPPIDGPSATALMAIAQKGNRRADTDQRWIQETAAFTTDANLRLALLAARLDAPTVEATPGGWKLCYFRRQPGIEVPRLTER